MASALQLTLLICMFQRWHHKFTFCSAPTSHTKAWPIITSSDLTAKTCPINWQMFHSNNEFMLSLVLGWDHFVISNSVRLEIKKEPWGHVARRHKTQNFMAITTCSQPCHLSIQGVSLRSHEAYILAIKHFEAACENGNRPHWHQQLGSVGLTVKAAPPCNLQDGRTFELGDQDGGPEVFDSHHSSVFLLRTWFVLLLLPRGFIRWLVQYEHKLFGRSDAALVFLQAVMWNFVFHLIVVFQDN